MTSMLPGTQHKSTATVTVTSLPAGSREGRLFRHAPPGVPFLVGIFAPRTPRSALAPRRASPPRRTAGPFGSPWSSPRSPTPHPRHPEEAPGALRSGGEQGEGEGEGEGRMRKRRSGCRVRGGGDQWFAFMHSNIYTLQVHTNSLTLYN